MDLESDYLEKYINEIISHSLNGIVEIKNRIEEIEDDEIQKNFKKFKSSSNDGFVFETYIEFIIYYMAQTDRILSNNVHYNSRIIFMDKLAIIGLELAIKYVCSDQLINEEIDEICLCVRQKYVKRILEYADDTEGNSQYNEYLFISNIVNLLKEKNIDNVMLGIRLHTYLRILIMSGVADLNKKLAIIFIDLI